MRFLGLFLCLLLTPSLAAASGLFDAPDGKLAAAGWAGFLDMKFMVDSLGALLLATALGAVIGFHPMTPRTGDTLTEADMPKVYIMYAFVAAVIGGTVREFGMVIGVVVFGVGGRKRLPPGPCPAPRARPLIAAALPRAGAGPGLP